MRRALLMALVFVAALLLPTPAFAAGGSYSIDELSTSVTVETNGTANIVERSIYTFDDRCEGCVWYLHVPEGNESVRISGVWVVPVDDGGTPIAEWTRLQAVDVNRRLQGEGPGDTAAASQRTIGVQPWYSYSIGDGMLRCYFPTEERAASASKVGVVGPVTTETNATNSYLIEVDYSIARRVRVYSDIAEFYWRYANSSLPIEAKDVNLTVSLPVPTNAGEIIPGETIVAWGHGPNTGTFEIGTDGTVTYHLDFIEAGNYAEAHIIFPSEWMTDVAYDAMNRYESARRDIAIAEERAWVDSGMRGERWDFGVRIVFLCVLIVVMLAGVVAVVRHGRSPRARRALIRVAATLGIIALGENLFFREPLTTAVLAGAAAVIGIASLFLPTQEEYGDDEIDAMEEEGDNAAENANEAADDSEESQDAVESVENAVEASAVSDAVEYVAEPAAEPVVDEAD